jgi:DNA-binding beta-propeller fold protein YncE
MVKLRVHLCIRPVFCALVLLAAVFGLRGSVVHADGGAPNLAYVSGVQGGVGVLDVQQQKITSTIKVDGDPHSVALSLDGRFLYVTQPQLNRLTIIAAKTGSEICHANIPGSPSLLAFDGYANLLYVAGHGSSTVTSIDPEQCTIKQRITTASPVYGIVLASVSNASSNTDQLWVSNEKSVSIYDASNAKSLGTVSIPGGPRYLSVPPGGTIYVTTASGQVEAIGLTSHTATSLISGGQYGPMDFNETTGEVYVPDQKNMQLVVLNPVNAGFALPKEPARVIKLNVAPASIAITSDGQLGFAALQDGSVAMYDIPGQQEVTRIHTGGTPHFIITGLYPPALGTTPQQATQITNLVNIVGYAIVVALLIVPFLLFVRFSRNRKRVMQQSAAEAEGKIEQRDDPVNKQP